MEWIKVIARENLKDINYIEIDNNFLEFSINYYENHGNVQEKLIRFYKHIIDTLIPITNSQLSIENKKKFFKEFINSSKKYIADNSYKYLFSGVKDYLGNLNKLSKLTNKLINLLIKNILILFSSFEKLNFEFGDDKNVFLFFCEKYISLLILNKYINSGDSFFQDLNDFIVLLKKSSKEKIIVILRNIFCNLQKDYCFDDLDLSKLQVIDLKNSSETCSETEKFNLRIIKENRKNIIILKSQGVILGHIKLKGENTFLCYIDYFNKKRDPILIRGGVYAVSQKIQDKIYDKELEINSEKVLCINLNRIKLTFLRFLTDKSLILSGIDELKRRSIEDYYYLEIKTLYQKKSFFRNFFSKNRNHED